MIRFGLVGCGAIGPVHADAIQQLENAELSACFDVLSNRSNSLADRFGCRVAGTLDELLQSCDAVIVATPSGTHAEIGKLAALRRKHVVVEKPIDVSLEKATDLVLAAERSGVRLATISQHRFSCSIQLLRRAAQSGELGKLIAGDAYIKWYRTQAYYDSGEWRGTWQLDGGGCLINQGIHMIDMIQWIMGGISSVQAQVRTAAHDIEVEDIAQVLVEYKNGATGVIVGSTATYPGQAERLEVYGKHGSVIIEGDRIKSWKADPNAAEMGLYGGGVMLQPTPTQHCADENEQALIERSALDKSGDWGEQHRLQLEDFTQAIENDREPYLTGRESLEPLRVITAIYASARTGQRIFLEDLKSALS